MELSTEDIAAVFSQARKLEQEIEKKSEEIDKEKIIAQLKILIAEQQTREQEKNQESEESDEDDYGDILEDGVILIRRRIDSHARDVIRWITQGVAYGDEADEKKKVNPSLILKRLKDRKILKESHFRYRVFPDPNGRLRHSPEQKALSFTNEGLVSYLNYVIEDRRHTIEAKERAKNLLKII